MSVALDLRDSRVPLYVAFDLDTERWLGVIRASTLEDARIEAAETWPEVRFVTVLDYRQLGIVVSRRLTAVA